MSDAWREIPAAHRHLLRQGLASAFGAAPIGPVAGLSGGASGAFLYRVAVGARDVVVRIEGAPSPLRNPRQYMALRHAAAAGIAPAVHHIDVAAGVAVMDAVAARPLDAFPGGPAALGAALGAMLRRLRATPRFPAFIAYPELVGRLWSHVCRCGLFAPGVLDGATRHLAALRAGLDWDEAGGVSSHNDLVAGNILFDGRRLWLIDWESACCSDPLVDVAVLLDQMPPAVAAALPGEFSDSPRLAAVRALTRLYYAGVLFSAAAVASPGLADRDATAPTPAEWRAARASGPVTRLVMGKMYLAAFLTGVAPPALA